jgi:peptidoglycan/xylan/chitin deacetylase (PgdA/CDA1 family)
MTGASAQRDLEGYGGRPPRVRWPDDAKIAVNFVVNYEEGSEYTVLLGDERNERQLGEVPSAVPPERRDLAIESMYEYGARAGIWRLFELFGEHGIRPTVFGSALALERSPAVAAHIRSNDLDVCAHGWRWIEHWPLTRQQERENIERAVRSLAQSTGLPPRGWYCRHGASENTRDLLVEIGGFLYDSDAYNDDLPYYTEVRGRRHLVVPYSLTYNDVQGTRSPQTFLDYCRRGFDELWREGERGVPKMMSVGLHARLAGQAARSSALRELIEHMKTRGGVWFARRLDLAEWWARHHAG